MYYYYDSSPLDVVHLFSVTLRRILSLPELSLFLSVALLLILFGVITWSARRGKRL